MPPKRKTKKELAAAAAAAAASQINITLTRDESNTNLSENNSDIESKNIPIVMQLAIPSKRIEEIIKDEEKKLPLNVDPLPYIKDNAFISENHNLDTNNLNKHHTHHEIICYWCCHNIMNIEYGMPVRYDVFHKNFTMFGSFCSLECASAYNFSINMGCDRAWEIHSWIQLLAKNYGLQTPIRPAPNKYLLDTFNGRMTIEEFRSSHKGYVKTYIMNIPPFIHINSQMEILNTSFLEKNKISEQKMIST